MKLPDIVLFLSLWLLFRCGGASEENGAQGVVATASPEATEAGIEILNRGGNAADAAVAVAFALGVTEPAMSGLGGGVQILLAVPGSEDPVAINGTTFAPAVIPARISAADMQFHRRSTVPSAVRTLDYLWRTYGSGRLSWSDLLAPAIRYAEKGFIVGPFRHKVYRRYGRSLAESPFSGGLVLLPEGNIPAPGDTLRQPVLASTLRRLAEAGANDFYQGEIARTIAADMEKNGGWITLSDLEKVPEPQEYAPLHTTFRGFDIYAPPPPSGGWNTLLLLNILELIPAEELYFPSHARLGHLIKTVDIAQRNRRVDPGDFERSVNRKLDKEYARQLLENYEEPYLVPIDSSSASAGETTHFSVVDADGMALAVTASINGYFGAQAAAPQLGFLYNTYMDDFELEDPTHPYALRAGAMAFSSMSPTIVRRDGQTVLVIGSTGRERITSTVAQLTQMWIDGNDGIKSVLATPRIHVDDTGIYIEDHNIPNNWIQELRGLGYTITFPSYDLMQDGLNSYFGGVHAIALEEGQWVGAADPRRDGEAARSEVRLPGKDDNQ